MTRSRVAGWGAIALSIVAAPAGAQIAKPAIPAVGTAWIYAGTIRTILAGKESVDVGYSMARRVIEAGPEWFKVEYDVPIGDRKMHYVEKHSVDPFAPPLSTETVMLTAAGQPAIAGASLTLTQRSGGDATGNLYPLEIGKTAQYGFTGIGKSGEVPGTRDCKIEGHASVAVPMGRYDAFSVRCKSQVSPTKDLRVEVEAQTQYAPTLGVVVGAQTRTVITNVPEAKVQSEFINEYKLTKIERPEAKYAAASETQLHRAFRLAPVAAIRYASA